MLVKATKWPRADNTIVGGGMMGLALAIELATAWRQLGIEGHIRIVEGGALGGGEESASSRSCQLWIHAQGVIYAMSQPGVALGLQRAVTQLEAWAPRAVSRPIALAITGADHVAVASTFDALDIWHREIPHETLHAWIPNLRIARESRVFRTRDGTLDLTLAAFEMARRAEALGVVFLRGKAKDIELGARDAALIVLESGERIPITQGEQVVLACGRHIRPLLARTGIALAGLRHFRSCLAAAPAGIDALVAILGGGANVVPHALPDGTLLDVFGDAFREEVSPEEDCSPVRPTARSVSNLRSTIAESFGFELPARLKTWAGIKVEIPRDGTGRSQAHHACLVPGTSNLWIALPGKLSQSPETARILTNRILAHSTASSCAHPVWEEGSRISIANG